MAERPGFPYDAEEARVDAELTRQELGETAQELAKRVKSTSRQVAYRAGTAIGLGVLILFVFRKLAHHRE